MMSGFPSGFERKLGAAVVGIWLVFSLLLGTLYAHLPPNPDQQIFDYIGWMAHRGSRLYLDVTEQNFPGKMWVHEFSTALFGNHVWSFRLFDYLWLLACVPLLVLTLRPALGPLRALLVVPFYQTMYVTAGSWMAGQRDIVAVPLLLGAGLAYQRRAQGGRRYWLLLFALGLICAALIRPTYLLFAPMLVLADALLASSTPRTYRAVLADTATAAAFCFGLIALILLVAWSNGSLQAWYESSILFNTAIYSHSQTYTQLTVRFLDLVKSWHWYLAFTLGGAWIWWKDGRGRREWATLVAIAATCVTSAYAQGKGFGYHLAGLVPVLAAFIVYFVCWCTQRAFAKRRLQSTAVALLVCGIAVLGLGKKVLGSFHAQIDWFAGDISAQQMLGDGGGSATYADVVAAAEHIRRTVPPEDTVLVWHRFVHVNFLAERASPVRFITVGMMTTARPPFTGAEAWTREVESAFTHHPPTVIVLPLLTNKEDEVLAPSSMDSGPAQIFWKQLESRYKPEISFGGLALFRLDPNATPSPP